MSLSPRDRARLSKTVKKSEGNRGGGNVRPSQYRLGNNWIVAELLEELDPDGSGEADAFDVQDGDETKIFKVHKWGDFGPWPEGTRGLCFLMGDDWIFAIPDSCPSEGA